MTAIDYPTGTDTTFTYDAGGRRTSMTDATGTTSWTYNAASELVGLSQPGSTLSYAYNASGQRTAMTRVGTGTTTTSYDAFGRVASVTNPFGETTSIAYDGLSRPVVKTMANGFTESIVYDAAGRPSTVALKDGSGTAVRTETYAYDLAGNVLSANRNGTATNYTYDAIDQLLTESKPGYSASYTYDANGNRLSRTVNGATDTYSYDAGDKLLSVVSPSGTRAYSYDAAGRTTAIAGPSGTRTFSYDVESRITAISGPGFSGSYSYNGFDTRVSKVENGVSRAFVRDGSGVTAPVLSDGAADYTPGISERRGGISTFFASVLKNSDVQVGASAVSAERKYDAFGNVLGSTGTWKSPFGYAGSFGYQEDESGYKLLGHRMYDPDTGRFLTRDPAKDGRNWYGYCENNPVTCADPEGLKPDGHHIIPKQMLDKGSFSSEVTEILKNITSGPLEEESAEAHKGFSTAHRAYNKAVIAQSEQFAASLGKTTKELTVPQARALVRHILRSEEPAVKGFLDVVLKKGGSKPRISHACRFAERSPTWFH